MCVWGKDNLKFTFFNHFDVSCTERKVHCLKVCSSVAIGAFTVLSSFHLYLVPEHFITPRYNLVL